MKYLICLVKYLASSRYLTHVYHYFIIHCLSSIIILFLADTSISDSLSFRRHQLVTLPNSKIIKKTNLLLPLLAPDQHTATAFYINTHIRSQQSVAHLSQASGFQLHRALPLPPACHTLPPWNFYQHGSLCLNQPIFPHFNYLFPVHPSGLRSLFPRSLLSLHISLTGSICMPHGVLC